MPKSDFTNQRRWLGFGFKSGGQLLIGGVESTTAFLWNLGNSETFQLEIVSSRWGLGLGGSGGAVAIIGFGIIEPYELHGKPLNDWGVNIAFTEKLITKSVMQNLVFMGRWASVYASSRALNSYRHVKTAVKDMEMLEWARNMLHTLYQGFETSKRSGIVVIDLPLVGLGLEVSVHLLRGTMYVSNSSDMDLGG